MIVCSIGLTRRVPVEGEIINVYIVNRGSGLSTCMRIKIDAMIAVELRARGLEIRQMLRTDFCGQGCYSSIDMQGPKIVFHLCHVKSQVAS